MTRTQFRADHTTLIPHRSMAYESQGNGSYKLSVPYAETYGDGMLHTTIGDLQKWDENFYTGKVGGPGFLKRQLQQGRLANGTVLSYAFGLTVSQYRGLGMVEHTGSTGGYRTIITRVPSSHTSIVALCNVSDANTTTLSHSVADVVLGAKFTKPAPPPRTPPQQAANQTAQAAASSADLATLPGRYYSEELDATYEVRVNGQAITVLRPRGEVDTLRVVGARTFRAGGTTYRFSASANGNPPGFGIDIGRARGIEFVRRDAP
jgi:hypothetical protein